MQLYNTPIRPAVTYASKTWVLKENGINKLMTFERKIMRKIYGATGTVGGYWGVKTNEETNLRTTPPDEIFWLGFRFLNRAFR
jgi:hypothetical protein